MPDIKIQPGSLATKMARLKKDINDFVSFDDKHIWSLYDSCKQWKDWGAKESIPLRRFYDMFEYVCDIM